MKKYIVAAILILVAPIAILAQKGEIFAPQGIAIKGFDAVAFHTEKKPVRGSDNLSYSWKNAKWLFSSTSNRDEFKKNPERYAPQYGGYCAYGTSRGYKAPTETDTWTLVDDKLYFNYNLKVKEAWNKDQQALIEKADLQWKEIKNKEQ